MIYAIIGLPGEGKTLSGVAYMRRRQWRYDVLVSNIRVSLDKPVVAVTSVDEMVAWSLRCYQEGKRLLMFIDEANLYFMSRAWNKLPAALLWLWSQNRKLGIDLVYTTQSFNRVDKVLREITNEVWRPKRIGPFVRVGVVPPTRIADDGIEMKALDSEVGAFWFLLRKDDYEAYETFELVDIPEWVEIAKGPAGVTALSAGGPATARRAGLSMPRGITD